MIRMNHVDNEYICVLQRHQQVNRGHCYFESFCVLMSNRGVLFALKPKDR